MLLGFKKQFIVPILTGIKGFTLRKRRKIRPKVGETIHMYTALRTIYANLITSKHNIKSIRNVRLTIYRHFFTDETRYEVKIYVDRKKLTNNQMKDFAVLDGFENLEAWAEYWLTDDRGKQKIRTGAMLEMYAWIDLPF